MAFLEIFKLFLCSRSIFTSNNVRIFSERKHNEEIPFERNLEQSCFVLVFRGFTLSTLYACVALYLYLQLLSRTPPLHLNSIVNLDHFLLS